GTDVDGDDDGATSNRLAAFQARVLRHRRRLDAARGSDGQRICAVTGTAVLDAASAAAPSAPRPIEKAAIILTAPGPELASSVLRDVNPDNLKRFAQATYSHGPVSQLTLYGVNLEFIAAF